MTWIVKPDANASGLWTQDISEADQKYEYMGTWLFKSSGWQPHTQGAESDMFALSVVSTTHSSDSQADWVDKAIYVQAWYSAAAPLTATTFNYGIYGARLYV